MRNDTIESSLERPVWEIGMLALFSIFCGYSCRTWSLSIGSPLCVMSQYCTIFPLSSEIILPFSKSLQHTRHRVLKQFSLCCLNRVEALMAKRQTPITRPRDSWRHGDSFQMPRTGTPYFSVYVSETWAKPQQQGLSLPLSQSKHSRESAQGSFPLL